MTLRACLSNRREHETLEFYHGDLGFTLGVGRYEDGRLAEVFISAHKTTTATEAVARDAAIVLSIALQHGAPIETIRDALTRDSEGGPATLIGAALNELAGEGGAQ